MQTAAPAEGGGAKCFTKTIDPASCRTSTRRRQADAPPNWRSVGSIAAAIIARRFDISHEYARVVAEQAGFGDAP